MGKKKRRSLAGESSKARTTVLIGEGQLLSGRYRVIEKIGTGGMGVVYKVKDEKLEDRLFALKTLPPDMCTNRAAIKRLKKEALAAIDMHHSNIMALHSFDNDGPHHFLVMEYLDGADLEDTLVDKERFSVEEMLAVAQQVCPALDYAHERGIVHRDIKPSNLIYKTEGGKQVVKIADFGIAYQVRNSIAKLTGQDTTGGTMHYMPPEQLAGKDVDGRADQYALASTLYELLRGRPPFEGAGVMLMRQIDDVAPDAIDGVPQIVNDALLKGLAKKPDDRFANCAELLEALSQKPEQKPEQKLKKKAPPKQKGGAGSKELADNLARLMNDIGMNIPRDEGEKTPAREAKSKKTEKPKTSKTNYELAWSKKAIVVFVALMGVMVLLSTWDFNKKKKPRWKPLTKAEKEKLARIFAAKRKNPKLRDEIDVAGITFCWCPPGDYMMGSPMIESGRDNDEGPQHSVKISKGFWLSKYEVLQREWKSVMKANPSQFIDSWHPVEKVSWHDCQEFITRLNRTNKKFSFRLPTEAEWEYACRAGTNTPYSVGDELSQNDANFGVEFTESGKLTKDYFKYYVNAFGLKNMHGNVWEWCSDWYSKDYYSQKENKDPKGPGKGKKRVVRGGGYGDGASDCRSASRKAFTPDTRFSSIGLRLLLEK